MLQVSCMHLFRAKINGLELTSSYHLLFSVFGLQKNHECNYKGLGLELDGRIFTTISFMHED